MTKARDIADFKFENIVDTGTEGTKVASGTTAQRGSTTGQLRFNTTTGLAEYYTGSEFKVIDTPPTITSIDVTNVVTDLGGTQTFVITGALFANGATVKFKDNGGTEITPDTTTVNSSSQITVTKTRSSFSNANEPYDVIVTNLSGLTGTLSGQINVDNSPVWSTASGNIATVYEGDTVNVSATATDSDGDTVSYSETTANLSGAGFSLNSSTGAITGTASAVATDTTNSFTLRATANTQTADRSFNIIVKDNGILESAEFYIDPSNSNSWSGSGSALTNITTYSGKSSSTTNLSLNTASVATTGGITYIETVSSDTMPTATIGNISGDIQNYTVVFFAKQTATNGNSDGGMFFYGNKTTNQGLGGNIGSSQINHYNYGNDSYFPIQTYTTWNMYTFRKVSNIKQVWYNTTQLTASSNTNNNTSLPANSTFDYGGRNAPSDYKPYDFNLGFCGIWATNISNSDITYLYNRFKGDYGL